MVLEHWNSIHFMADKVANTIVLVLWGHIKYLSHETILFMGRHHLTEYTMPTTTPHKVLLNNMMSQNTAFTSYKIKLPEMWSGGVMMQMSSSFQHTGPSYFTSLPPPF